MKGKKRDHAINLAYSLKMNLHTLQIHFTMFFVFTHIRFN